MDPNVQLNFYNGVPSQMGQSPMPVPASPGMEFPSPGIEYMQDSPNGMSTNPYSNSNMQFL